MWRSLRIEFVWSCGQLTANGPGGVPLPDRGRNGFEAAPPPRAHGKVRLSFSKKFTLLSRQGGSAATDSPLGGLEIPVEYLRPVPDEHVPVFAQPPEDLLHVLDAVGNSRDI